VYDVVREEGENMTDNHRRPTLFEQGVEAGYRDGKRADWARRLEDQVFIAAHLPALIEHQSALIEHPHARTDELAAGYMVGIVRGLRELADQEQEARA
jgi:hypothetical protein